MRSRKLLLCVIGAAGLLALVTGILSRPEDEYAALRSLHPREEFVEVASGSTVRSFYFKNPPSLVMDSLPRNPDRKSSRFDGRFPSGNFWNFITLQPGYGMPGETCRVNAYERRSENWLATTWQNLKRRLGI